MRASWKNENRQLETSGVKSQWTAQCGVALPSPFPLGPSHPPSFTKGTCRQHCLIRIDIKDDLCILFFFGHTYHLCFPCSYEYLLEVWCLPVPSNGEKDAEHEWARRYSISWEGVGNENQVSSALVLRESLSSGWGHVFTETMWKLSIFILRSKKLTGVNLWHQRAFS